MAQSTTATDKFFIYTLNSPIGGLEIKSNSTSILSIKFCDSESEIPTSSDFPSCMLEAISQLKEYFDGDRKQFDLNLELEGTDFQKRVWRSLIEIPYGETRSYKDIAIAIDSPKGFRAIGMANNKNKIPVVIPCHRVIQADGELGGYAGGVKMKKWLLDLELNN